MMRERLPSSYVVEEQFGLNIIAIYHCLYYEYDFRLIQEPQVD